MNKYFKGLFSCWLEIFHLPLLCFKICLVVFFCRLFLLFLLVFEALYIIFLFNFSRTRTNTHTYKDVYLLFQGREKTSQTGQLKKTHTERWLVFLADWTISSNCIKPILSFYYMQIFFILETSVPLRSVKRKSFIGHGRV